MDKISLTVKLSHEEASALALLCRQLNWGVLTSYSSGQDECIQNHVERTPVSVAGNPAVDKSQQGTAGWLPK